MTDFWRGDDGRMHKRERGQAADEGHLIIATLGLARGLHMHLLRRWARNKNDERGDFDVGWHGADERWPGV